MQGVRTSGVGMDLVIRSAGGSRVVANTYDSNAPFSALGTWTTQVLAGGSYRLEYWPSYVSGGQVICGVIESVSFTVPPPPTPTPTPTPVPPTPTPTPVPPTPSPTPTPTPAPQPAPAPNNVTATNQTTTATEACPKVQVSWNAVTDAASYRVEQQQTGSTTWTVAGTATTTSLDITGLNRSTTYKFRVSAIGDGDPYSSTTYGSPSAAAEATTGTCFPTLNAPTATAGTDHTSIVVNYTLPEAGYNYRLQLLLVEDLDSTVQSTHDIAAPSRNKATPSHC